MVRCRPGDRAVSRTGLRPSAATEWRTPVDAVTRRRRFLCRGLVCCRVRRCAARTSRTAVGCRHEQVRIPTWLPGAAGQREWCGSATGAGRARGRRCGGGFGEYVLASLYTKNCHGQVRHMDSEGLRFLLWPWGGGRGRERAGAQQVVRRWSSGAVEEEEFRRLVAGPDGRKSPRRTGSGGKPETRKFGSAAWRRVRSLNAPLAESPPVHHVGRGKGAGEEHDDEVPWFRVTPARSDSVDDGCPACARWAAPEMTGAPAPAGAPEFVDRGTPAEPPSASSSSKANSKEYSASTRNSARYSARTNIPRTRPTDT